MSYHSYDDQTGKCRDCGSSRVDWEEPCVPPENKKPIAVNWDGQISHPIEDYWRLLSDEIAKEWAREVDKALFMALGQPAGALGVSKNRWTGQNNYSIDGTNEYFKKRFGGEITLKKFTDDGEEEETP